MATTYKLGLCDNRQINSIKICRIMLCLVCIVLHILI